MDFSWPMATADRIDEFMVAAAKLAGGMGYTIQQANSGGAGACREAPAGFEYDTPAILTEAEKWLSETAPVAVEGMGGDRRAVLVAYALGDIGLSPEAALDHMI